MAVRLHRAIFEDSEDDEDGNSKVKDISKLDVKDGGIFTISQNLIQRKQQHQKSVNDEDNENRMMNDDIKKMNNSEVEFELSDSTSFESTSANSSVGNFKRSTNNDDNHRENNFTKNLRNDKSKKSNNQRNEEGNTQSFVNLFKSLFRCKKTRKINEQIESDYPMNLHLRMNEIFSMHDKLSDIAEDLNDLYSTGRKKFNELIELEEMKNYPRTKLLIGYLIFD